MFINIRIKILCNYRMKITLSFQQNYEPPKISKIQLLHFDDARSKQTTNNILLESIEVMFEI